MRFWYRYKVWVVPGLNCQRAHLFARDTLLYKLAICSKYKLQRLAPCVIILIASINHQLASSPLSSLQLDSDAGQQRPKNNLSNQPPRLKTHFPSAFQRMGKGFRRRGCSRLCDGRAIARCWICPDSAYISIIGTGDRRSDCPTSPRGTIGNKSDYQRNFFELSCLVASGSQLKLEHAVMSFVFSGSKQQPLWHDRVWVQNVRFDCNIGREFKIFWKLHKTLEFC